ncbi:MAG TPA: DUF6655 family protein [Verrucomicrobiae bacterium]|nr:DUF6655 family protein [Verrucomicrobiae bacterium]
MNAIEQWMVTLGAFLLLIALMLTGCSTSEMTNPARSVTEQLLLSTAMDRALTNDVFSFAANKKVFLDDTYFKSYDSEYMMGDIRDALSSAGALMVDDATNADIIVQPRSGGLSIDSSQSIFGIPKTEMPMPLSGGIALPEIALAKSGTQHSIAKIRMLAYAEKSREHVYSSGPLVGKAYNKYHKILWVISWTSTDIPEKQKK